MCGMVHEVGDITRGRMTERKRPEYSRRNLAAWERAARWYENRHARALRKYHGKAWGTFRVPERKIRLLDEVRGKEVLELGCGAAGWSIALTRDGAHAVGLDFSRARLAQARRMMKRAHLTFPLIRASAERIPYPDGHFDLVLSDYGATTFADPYRTIPEVARVLRHGGALIFAHASSFRSVAHDPRADRLRRTLVRAYFGMHALRADDSTEFQHPYSEWIRLFASSGPVVERLEEPRAPTSWRSSYLTARDQAWSRRWPSDSIWKLRKVTLPTVPSRRDGGRV